MSKGVAAAFDAIRKAEGVRATLTALGTQIEADSLNHVINAVRDAHEAAKRAGALRIVSTIKIDERLDKSQTLEDKVDAVRQRLKE
jgi:uncharacterized protein (TIGR00106 family)